MPDATLTTSNVTPGERAADPASAPTLAAALEAGNPFRRLGRLLEGLEPGRSPLPDGRPISLAIGDPLQPPPAFLPEVLGAERAGWGRYPPGQGSGPFPKAAVAWAERRFVLPEGFLDPAANVAAVPGSREGVFMATLALAPPAAAGARPVMLLPDPAYHVYVSAALATGAEPVFVPSLPETGLLPDFEAVDPAILARTRFAFLNTPSNPEGAAAGLDRLKRTLALARRHGFTLIVDECYCDVWRAEPPASALQAAAESGTLANLLVFHSVSKRSNAAGLRLGFAIGEESLVRAVSLISLCGGAGVSAPVQAAGVRLLEDEAHVEAVRRFYQGNVELAQAHLPARLLPEGPPDAGFFLWLDVGDGEAAARRLWREAGIRVVPGICMAQGPAREVARRRIRVALVEPPEILDPVLRRMGELL